MKLQNIYYEQILGVNMTTISKVIKGVELELEFNYTPGKPGKLDGPWEYCYPDEFAGVEMLAINIVYIDTLDLKMVCINIMDLLSDEVKDLVDEYAYVWGSEQ